MIHVSLNNIYSVLETDGFGSGCCQECCASVFWKCFEGRVSRAVFNAHSPDARPSARPDTHGSRTDRIGILTDLEPARLKTGVNLIHTCDKLELVKAW